MSRGWLNCLIMYGSANAYVSQAAPFYIGSLALLQEGGGQAGQLATLTLPTSDGTPSEIDPDPMRFCGPQKMG